MCRAGSLASNVLVVASILLCSRVVFGQEGTDHRPDFLDDKVSKWDPLIIGYAAVFGLEARLATYNWEATWLSPLDVGLGFVPLVGATGHVGPTVGVGKRLGAHHERGLWLTCGLWWGGTASFTGVGGERSEELVGIFLPAGVEWTTHFGERLDWLWGLRVLAVVNVWGRRSLGECDPPGTDCFFCVPCDDVEKASPFSYVVSVFLGW